MLCDAIQRIPGNSKFEHRYEFATTVKHYWGQNAYIAFQIFYNIALQTSNIAAMIISAQVLDQLFQKTRGHSYALDFQHGKFIKSTTIPTALWCEKGYFSDDYCEEGHELTWVISIGYMIAMAICIPFGYLNLDDNMWFQWFSLAGLLIFTSEFWVCGARFCHVIGSTVLLGNGIGSYASAGWVGVSQHACVRSNRMMPLSGCLFSNHSVSRLPFKSHH
jgi:hypothetical protein